MLLITKRGILFFEVLKTLNGSNRAMQNRKYLHSDLPESAMQWRTWKSRMLESLTNYSMFFDSLQTMECWIFNALC